MNPSDIREQLEMKNFARLAFALALLSTPANSHGDWDWIRQGFPDYRSQYSPPDLPYNCCGEHDIEKLNVEDVVQDGDDYVIYGFQRFPVAKAYPSERGYPVVSWKLGDWVAETDSGQYVNLAPNVPGKVWNGKHIIGIHCFFFAPGGA